MPLSQRNIRRLEVPFFMHPRFSKRFPTAVLPLLTLFAACAAGDRVDSAAVLENHSWSRPAEVAVTHLALDLDVDFEARSVSGRVRLTLDNRTGATELWLDTRDLELAGVTLGPDGGAADWSVGEAEPFVGSPLRIAIQPDTEYVDVEYASRPPAAALQWLTPEQTTGGRFPFLLSQGQAILTRSWLPCQDTPAVRVTYDATVRVPPGMMALMSAENPTETSADGVYRFRMQQPLSPYLLVIAAGELEFRPIGERSGIYAEPEVVEAAAWEFGETESMIASAEKLYGPYRWERYDMLVLPASFPFGGMENPRLTFLTPTVLAGDRSLVSLVAHELAHSWSGNLVTNETWDDFWLNEGFTTYIERRIMEEIAGRDYSEMLALLGLQDLQGAVEELGAGDPDTHLRLDLTGRDPDDGMTDVAYEKGYLMLRLLEETAGRERWDAFLREYFDAWAFRPMTTERFIVQLQSLFEDPAELAPLELEKWIYGPGIPVNAPVIRSSAFDDVDKQLAAFLGEGPSALWVDGWSTHEWLHFLRGLPESMTLAQMADLDARFDLTHSGNSEILHAWLMQAIAHGYEPAYPAVEEFLTRQGRRKFLRPLYTEMARTPEGKQRALAIYDRARGFYHPLASSTIDEVLGL